MPVILRIVSAIVSAAPLFSRRAPMTVPIAITIPIPAIVPPSPSAKEATTSGRLFPIIMPKNNAEKVSAKNGCSLTLTVSRTRSAIANTIQMIVNAGLI